MHEFQSLDFLGEEMNDTCSMGKQISSVTQFLLHVKIM